MLRVTHPPAGAVPLVATASPYQGSTLFIVVLLGCISLLTLARGSPLDTAARPVSPARGLTCRTIAGTGQAKRRLDPIDRLQQGPRGPEPPFAQAGASRRLSPAAPARDRSAAPALVSVRCSMRRSASSGLRSQPFALLELGHRPADLGLVHGRMRRRSRSPSSCRTGRAWPACAIPAASARNDRGRSRRIRG